MKASTACSRLVDDYRSRPTLRAGSLITTVFGDSIAPRGGKVWLGSLIESMALFGIGERSVRTSVFRLVRDGWLQSEQIGRRSYYSLSEDGRQRFEQATHRIYSSPTSAWDGTWCLLLLSGLETATKEVVRKEFAWLGFGAMSSNVLAHPDPDTADLDLAIQRTGVVDDLVVLSAQTIRNEMGMRRLAHESWNLADLDARYSGFVALFRPLLNALKLMTRGTTNGHLKKSLEETVSYVGEGGGLAKAMGRSDVFPIAMIDRIAIGEQSGELGKAFAKAARKFDEDLDIRIKRLVGILPVILLIVMAVVVGMVAYAMITTIFSSMTGISGR